MVLHPLSFLVLGGIAAGSFVQQIDAVGQEVLRCCMVAMLYALCCSVNGTAVGLHFRSWVCRGVSAAIFGIISTGFQVHHHWALFVFFFPERWLIFPVGVSRESWLPPETWTDRFALVRHRHWVEQSEERTSVQPCACSCRPRKSSICHRNEWKLADSCRWLPDCGNE